jgi:anti-sigma regulatory factor (Ser/Thr protein kinase)
VTDRLREGASRVRLVGEPAWPSSGPREFLREWERYESILNTVLAPFPVTLVCTYPASRLDAEIVQDSMRTHPMVARRAGWQPSERFEEPASLVGRWNPALAPPPADAEPMPRPVDLASARGFVVARATRAGLSAERAMDLELAVDEILTNAIVHAGGIAALRTWLANDCLICQVEDRGGGVADTLAGYRPPATSPPGGRGLWLARQAVDLLQIVTTGAGTTVRLHVRLNDR